MSTAKFTNVEERIRRIARPPPPRYYLRVEKNRIEAFSDSVIAIIITIMVLNLVVPKSDDISALESQLPVFLTYALSYLYVGIYWNNHHHLLKAARRATSGVMWANLHFLFWLSLFPFMTGWMGQNHFSPAPTAVYGAVLLMAAIAYFILQRMIIMDHGRDSKLAREIGKDWKGKFSLVLYATGMVVAFWHGWISSCIYTLVALMWLIPDRRLERVIHEVRD
ncbi:MAG TPA: TMEM175 family protein [Candidatus Acidoferrales bacterium]|jgi:uncharacterized membrane protein|nr:TMEM175 family protein [Candidatus Acidoferrales bacterium]